MGIESLMFFFIFIITTYYTLVNSLGIFINIYCKRFDVKRNYDYQPSVSVVISCFNEGASVYNTIKSMRCSDYPTDKLKIYVFDDSSPDDSFFWIKKAVEDFPNVIAHKKSKNQGNNNKNDDAFNNNNNNSNNK